MNITLKKSNNVEGSLVVSLDHTDYQERVESKLKEFSKKAQIKGFRPGKVPVGMVKKMYGKSILLDEINGLLSEKVDQYLKDEKVRFIGRPLPNIADADSIDWDNQTSFEFSYEVGLVPDFKLDLANLKVEKLVIKSDKKTIDETIDNLKKQFSKVENVEESKEGDFLGGKLVGKDVEFEKDILIPTKQIKKDLKKFLGLKIGDKVVFELDKVFEDENDISYLTGVSKDEAKNLKGNFELTVDSITRNVEAELNQELFDKTFGKDAVTTEDEFRAKIEETILQNYEREAAIFLNKTIMDELVDKTKFDLSKDFLVKFIKATNDRISDEDVNKNLDEYIQDLKWTLIRNEFIKDDKIEVSGDEVFQAAKSRILSQFNMSHLPAEMEDRFAPIVDNYLREDNGRNYMNEYENILTGKVLDKMAEKVAVKEKKVSVDEFNKEVTKK